MTLTYIHLSTILPALVIGGYLLAVHKGTPRHRTLGKIYGLLMLVTAVTTLFMNAEFGPTLLDHFGFIHLFSILTLYSVIAAYIAIKKGDIRQHKYNMIGLYNGGIIIAGFFALMPGRMLHTWLFT